MVVDWDLVKAIPVGDELLRGETKDLNSSRIAEELNGAGIDLDRICVVPDEKAAIEEELVEGLNLLTGGLGPTRDDLTREAVADALALPLEENREALEGIKSSSDHAEHERMAMLPEGSTVLGNEVGVAPGFIVEKGGIQVVAMPGPPPEMEAVLSEAIDELGLKQGSGEEIGVYSVTPRTEKREGAIVPALDEAFDRFPDLEIGSYPEPDGVRIRLAGEEERVKEAEEWLRKRL